MIDDALQARALDVKARHRDRLRAYPNVRGVGVGFKVVGGQRTAELCVRVYVAKKVPESSLRPQDVLPRTIDGVPVDVIEAEGRALYGGPDLTPAERAQFHPYALVGGLRLSDLSLAPGTLGMSVFDRSSGRQLMLSNWHVLSDGNPPGWQVFQPGVAGTAELLERPDRILPPFDVGTLLRSAFTEYVDAAVAEVTRNRYLLDWISGIGVVQGSRRATLGMRVVKSGRATGLTRGTVVDISADQTITYGRGDDEYDRNFIDQIIVEADEDIPIVLGGDSGSVVLSEDDGRAVGLLFGGPKDGSETDGLWYVANHIDRVLSALDIEIRPGLTPWHTDLVLLA